MNMPIPQPGEIWEFWQPNTAPKRIRIDVDGAYPKTMYRKRIVAAEQPAPLHNASQPIWELVIQDMHARDHVGRQKYGTPLQAHNGRDVLQDAYEEALDLCVYLRQALVERDQ